MAALTTGIEDAVVCIKEVARRLSSIKLVPRDIVVEARPKDQSAARSARDGEPILIRGFVFRISYT